MKKLLAFLLVAILCLGIFTACGKEDAGLAKAAEYIDTLYKNKAEATPNDYDVVGKVVVDGTTYTVTWTVDAAGVTVKESSKAGFYTIDVDSKTLTEIAYTLKATISNANGDTVTKEYARKVPAYKTMSYAEYAAAKDDDTVIVSGIITGIFSKTNGSSANGMYVQDLNNDGGYYIYGFADSKDPEADLGLKVGMTVEVSGAKDTYNGLYEVVNAVVEIIDSNITTVAPIDYTEILANATALNDAALVGKQSLLVTIKGVEIGGQQASNGYYYFKLGNHETYVRLSSSNNCISLTEKTTLADTHTANNGKQADVTGIIQLYNGNFYLIPATVDAFSNFKEIERTDAEKVQFELDKITIDASFSADTVITLPIVGANYNTVKLSYASNDASIVVDNAAGTLTITIPENKTTVTITVTATIGEGDTAITETKEITTTLSKTPVTNTEFNTIAGALGTNNATTPEKYLVHGIITEIKSEVYGNMYITDANGVTVYLYGLYDAEGNRYDAMTNKPVVGDYIMVSGAGSYFNGPQMKNGTVVKHTTPTELATIDGTVTDVEYLVTGVVTEVANTTYGNLYIADADGKTL